jgi:hypothetical protein
MGYSPLRRLIAGLFGLAMIVGCASIAQAFSCYPSSQQLSAQTVSDFLANPSQILQQNPNGGAQMISRIRDLSASDSATLQPILALIANADKNQKFAIGSALGQAAKICGGLGQGEGRAYANDIQQAIAVLKDQDVVLAYAAAAGNQPIGAAGAGPGGSVGGQLLPFGTNGVSSSLENIGSPGVNTFQFTYSSSVSGGSSTTATTTTIIRPGNSVSP